jgi:hypothetical protein
MNYLKKFREWAVNLGERLIDRAGDWNAQLFRELKGRITPLGVMLTVGAAGFAQVWVLGIGWLKLVTIEPHQAQYSSYCLLQESAGYPKKCQVDALGQVVINWHAFWSDQSLALYWIIFTVLIGGGTYLLANDFLKERRRGTLDFLRLTPQSGREIIGGKLLGVPVLLYGFTALLLPLYLWAAVHSGSGWGEIILGNGIGGAVVWLFLLLTCWGMLLAPLLPIGLTLSNLWLATMLLTVAAYPPQLLSSLSSNSGEFWWFFLPLSQPLMLPLFTLGTLVAINFWLWQAVVRRYRSPGGTVLAKTDSYGLNLCCQAWLLGFAIPLAFQNQYHLKIYLGIVAGMNLMLFWLILVMLLPARSALQNWSRYRREGSQRGQPWFARHYLWQDLLRSDRTPVVGAMALQGGILLGCWLPLVIVAFHSSLGEAVQAIAVLGLAVFMAWNLALLYQLLAMAPGKDRLIKALRAIVLLTILLGPPALGGFLTLIGQGELSAWVLVMLSPTMVLQPLQAPIFLVGLSGLSQLIAGFWMARLLQKRLGVMGRSTIATLGLMS